MVTFIVYSMFLKKTSDENVTNVMFLWENYFHFQKYCPAIIV